MATFNMSRSASSFESGIGRGLGFRDSNQDLLGFVHMVPARARERILDLAATQFATGGAYHQYQPLTKRGNNDIGGGFNDDPHWLILGVAAYLKETGDWSILDEPVPFDNEAGSEAPLYEHLQRSFQLHARPPRAARAAADRPRRLERLPEPELLLRHAGRVLPDHDEQRRQSRRVGVHRRPVRARRAAELAAIASSAAWPTKRTAIWPKPRRWRADRPSTAGTANGSCAPTTTSANRSAQREREGQDLHRVAWLLRAGRHRPRTTARPPSALSTRAQAPRHQTRHRGAAARLHPYYLDLGEISSYPPGYKENAGIFCHVNPWVMIAETRLGHGDAAFDYYTRINPSAREEISDLHRCEPYVYAQMIAAKTRPPSARPRTPGSPARRRGTTSRSRSGFWASGPIRRPARRPGAARRLAGFHATRRFRGATYHSASGRAADARRLLAVDAGMLVDPGIAVRLPLAAGGDVGPGGGGPPRRPSPPGQVCPLAQMRAAPNRALTPLHPSAGLRYAAARPRDRRLVRRCRCGSLTSPVSRAGSRRYGWRARSAGSEVTQGEIPASLSGTYYRVGADPGVAAVRRARLLLQRRRHGRHVPVRRRVLRLPFPLRADAALPGRARGAAVPVRRVPQPVHRRPVGRRACPAGSPTPMCTGTAGGCSRPRRTARRSRSTRTPWTRSGSSPGTATCHRRPRPRIPRSTRATGRSSSSGTWPRARRRGTSPTTRRTRPGDRARGLVPGAVLVDGARLGRHRELRGLPDHPAHRQPRAAQGGRAALRVGRVRGRLSGRGATARLAPSAGTGAPTGSPRTS